MKFALFLVIVNASPYEAPGENMDFWWAIDGSMTLEDCQQRKAEFEPMRAAMFGNATATRLECLEDHAPDEW